MPMRASAQANSFEAGLAKDRPAYKRLREEGLQPHALKGAAELEARASSKWEIESGRILPERDAKRVDAANAEAAHIMDGGAA